MVEFHNMQKETYKRTQTAALYLTMGLMLVGTVFLTVKGTVSFVDSSNVQKAERCIVIDAGHGGDDPGKIGINGALEKDLNLEIARKVESLLRLEGIETVLTRTGSEGLYDAGPAASRL